MIIEKLPQIKELSSSEKMLLVNELWNDLVAHPSEIPVSRETLAELDRRIEKYEKNPESVTTWEEAKVRILRSRR